MNDMELQDRIKVKKMTQKEEFVEEEREPNKIKKNQIRVKGYEKIRKAKEGEETRKGRPDMISKRKKEKEERSR